MGQCRGSEPPANDEPRRDNALFPEEIWESIWNNVRMTTSGLRSDLQQITALIGQWVKMSGGHFSWMEQSKVKADMMNVPARWNASRITPSTLQHRCQAVGLKGADAAKIADWLSKVQAGRRLVPHSSYKTFRFTQDPTDD